MKKEGMEVLSDESLEEVAGGNIAGIYECKYCGKEFASLRQKEAHEAQCSAKNNMKIIP